MTLNNTSALFPFLFAVLSVFTTQAQISIGVMTQKGHSEGITSIRFSGDGKYFASGADSPDGSILVWDYASRKQLIKLEGHEDAINDLLFVQKGSEVSLLSSSSDGTIRKWDLSAGKGQIIYQSASEDIGLLDWDEKGGRLFFVEDQQLKRATWSPGGTFSLQSGSIKLRHPFGVVGPNYDRNSGYYLLPETGQFVYQSADSVIVVESATFRRVRGFPVDGTLAAARGGSAYTYSKTKIVQWSAATGKMETTWSFVMPDIAPPSKETYDPETGTYSVQIGFDREIGKLYLHGETPFFVYTASTGTPRFFMLDIAQSQGRVVELDHPLNDFCIHPVQKKILTRFYQPFDNTLRLDLLGFSEGDENALGQKTATNWIRRVRFLENDHFLVGLEGGKVMEISLSNLLDSRSYDMPSNDAIWDIDVCEEAGFFIATDAWRTYLWELGKTDKPKKVFPSGWKSIGLSTGGEYLVTGYAELWKTRMELMPEWAPEEKITLGSIVFSPQTGAFYVAEEPEPMIVKMTGETNSHSSVRHLPLLFPAKTDNLLTIFDWVKKMTISDDGKLLFMGCMDGKVIAYEVLEDSIVKTFHPHESWVSGLAYHAEKNLLLTASYDGYVRLWDYASNKLLFEAQPHTDFIEDVDFSADGNFFLTAGKDGQVFLYDVNRKKQVLRFFFNRAGFSVFSEDNHYYAQKGTLEDIAFIQDLRPYPVEQFDLQYNRPDLVLKAVGLASDELEQAYYKAYQKRLKRLNFSEEKLQGTTMHVPQIKVSHALASGVSSEEVLPVTIRAWDDQVKLDRLQVYVNEVPLFGQKGLSLKERGVNTYESTLSVPLSLGENKVQISVINQAGAESPRESFFVRYFNPTRKPDLYVIGMGLAEFANPAMNLDYPAKDVADLAKALGQTRDLYGNVVIREYYDQEITPGLLAQIRKELLRTRPDDRVVLFVAGHGIVDANLDYYLATYRTDFEKPKGSAIAYEALEQLLDSIPARQKLFLLDACHSGEIDKETVELIKEKRTSAGTVKFRAFNTRPVSTVLGIENTFEVMRELFVDFQRGTGAMVIASASGVEFAMEGADWSNSVFTYCLLTGILNQAADLDRNGQVMVSELQQYLAREVVRLTDGKQHPAFRVETIFNDWRIR